MIEMPSDLDRPWEPWTPKVGDRVSVRLNGECKHKFAARSARSHQIFRGVPHAREHDGLTGTVIERPSHWPAVPMTSHRYYVRFDVPPVTSYWGGVTTMAPFAAIELEPLEDNRA